MDKTFYQIGFFYIFFIFRFFSHFPFGYEIIHSLRIIYLKINSKNLMAIL